MCSTPWDWRVQTYRLNTRQVIVPGGTQQTHKGPVCRLVRRMCRISTAWRWERQGRCQISCPMRPKGHECLAYLHPMIITLLHDCHQLWHQLCHPVSQSQPSVGKWTKRVFLTSLLRGFVTKPTQGRDIQESFTLTRTHTHIYIYNIYIYMCVCVCN